MALLDAGLLAVVLGALIVLYSWSGGCPTTLLRPSIP
jgi:hypothetical protein